MTDFLLVLALCLVIFFGCLTLGSHIRTRRILRDNDTYVQETTRDIDNSVESIKRNNVEMHLLILKLINKDIQDYVSHHGTDLPTPLIKLLSDLDFTVRTGSKQRS